MCLEGKHILIILGGTYHDFEGFRASMQPVFEASGCQVSSTYDLEILARLPETGANLVLSYTCLTERRGGQPAPKRLTDEQVIGLVNWVQAGGAFLAVHAATVSGGSAPAYTQLLGGAFLWHPPAFSFKIYPLAVDHPITAGIPAFEVSDEFYIQRIDPDVQVHMLALHEDRAHPMVWSKTAGSGRVACIAMGHSTAVWELGLYRQMLLQAAEWLVG